MSQASQAVLLGMLGAMLLLLQQPALGAQEERLQLEWGQLAEHIQGRKVMMMLRSGQELEGEVRSVESQSLRIQISKSSRSYATGLHSIPRSEVSVLRYEERSGPWRALGTGIGAGGGAAAGIPIYRYADNESRPKAGAAIAAGLIAGGAALGYLIGRQADRRAVVISVID